MAQSNSSASYSGHDVVIQILPDGRPPINILAKSDTFLSITRTTPSQLDVTVFSGHQVATRARDSAKMFAISVQDTAPEMGALRALLAAQEAALDAGAGPIYCTVVARDPNGRKVMHTMPRGVFGDYPDEDFSFAPGDLTCGFKGAATESPLP